MKVVSSLRGSGDMLIFLQVAWLGSVCFACFGDFSRTKMSCDSCTAVLEACWEQDLSSGILSDFRLGVDVKF